MAKIGSDIVHQAEFWRGEALKENNCHLSVHVSHEFLCSGETHSQYILGQRCVVGEWRQRGIDVWRYAAASQYKLYIDLILISASPIRTTSLRSPVKKEWSVGQYKCEFGADTCFLTGNTVALFNADLYGEHVGIRFVDVPCFYPPK